MKKRIVLFTATAAICYLTLTSHSNGPAVNGYNRTGAHGTTATCADGGCHGSGTGPVVTISVMKGSTATTHYSPGQTYNVKIHGSGTTNPKFGFQFAAVIGTGSAQTSVGTFNSSALGTMGMHTHMVGGITLVEHALPFTVPTAGTYDTAFTWTAPAAGTGSVTMYCTINAVNGNTVEDAGDVSGHTTTTLTEGVLVPQLSEAIGIKTYPNPVVNNVHIQMSNADAGTYAFNVFDITGRTISTQNVQIANSNYETNINTGSWTKGFYLLQVVKDDAQRTIQLVKE